MGELREKKRLMREAKIASKPPVITRDNAIWAKKQIIKIIDEHICENHYWDDEKAALVKERDRLKKLYFGEQK